MLLTRLCLVMYATPRMLKLLLFCLWPSRIVVPFGRSILIVLKIGLFVNCVSAKPAQTLFLGQRPVGPLLQPVLLLLLLTLLILQQVQPLLVPRVVCVVLHFVPQGTLPSRRVAGFKDLWYPAFLLLFVIVFNACHVHL